MKTQTTPAKIKIVLLSLFMVILCLQALAQKTSLSSTNWNTSSTWSPAGVPSAGDIVTVNHAVVLNKNLTGGSGITGSLNIQSGQSLIQSGARDMLVKTGGELVVDGILEVNDLTFSNGSRIRISSTGVVIVIGNFSNNNNSNDVTVDGSMTILGSAYNGNGGVISGTGHISTASGFTGSGSFSGGISLPVDILSFTGETGKGGVLVKWVTASESGNDYFVLESSTDGVNYSMVQKVAGSGNSSVVKEYSILDEPAYGMVYYRLMQVDYNGQSTYVGGIIVYNNAESSTLELFPNPVTDSNVTVRMLNGIGNFRIVLTDMSGRVVFQYSGTDGSGTVSVPRSVLREGIYILNLQSDTINTSRQLIVK